MAISTSFHKKGFQSIVNFRKMSCLKNLRDLRKTLNLSRIKGNPDEVGLYRHPVERFAWFLIHVIAIICMSLMIFDTTIQYQNSPTVTTVETEQYPVQNINFPAISICNINRISRKEATDLAKELLELERTKDNLNLTIEELNDLLMILGHFFLFDINETTMENVDTLHMILKRAYNNYDVTEIMKKLAPSCKSILRQCSWKGKNTDCTEIFVLRRTDNGHCCTFNYARSFRLGSVDDLKFTAHTIEKPSEIGPEYGLSLLLDHQMDDYTYPILAVRGFKIQIYSPLELPDAASGNLHEVLIGPRVEAFLRLNAVSLHAVSEVAQYDISQRDCLFSKEKAAIFGKYYSFSDCLLHCRANDIARICRCIPFFYPSVVNKESWKVCNLKDLLCLKRHKKRWLNLKPRNERNMVPFNEDSPELKSNYVSCDCFPSCEDIIYTVSVQTIPLSSSNLTWNGETSNITDHSLVHIFFASPGTIRLKQDVLFYWYELVSHYGGICGLFLGVSVISIVEMLYSLVIRYNPLKRLPESTISCKETSDVKIKTITVQPVQLQSNVLYWNEITSNILSQPKKIEIPSVIGDLSRSTESVTNMQINGYI